MVINLEIEVLSKLYDFIDEFKQSEDYVLYKELEKTIQEKYFYQISNFNRLKEEYEASLKYNDEALISKQKKELFEAKTKLYNEPLMIQYKKLELNLEFKLKEFNNELKKRIME